MPVLAIVGAPNVGKSTLFNRLTGTRDALVADEPGVTRDRQYGTATVDSSRFLVVDTGGVTTHRDAIQNLTTEQAERAVEEADAVLLVVDGRSGVSAADEDLAKELRRLNKPVRLAVNKTEGFDHATVTGEFHRLGLGEPLAISAAHGHGVKPLARLLATLLPETDALPEHDPDRIRVAFVGKPNVGKSTLVNRLLGEERVVAHDTPGTTRDSIKVDVERRGQRYTLIDTAGIRRRSRVSDGIEKFSIIKSLQSMELAQVVVLMIDAREGVTDQDATLLDQVERKGCALVIAVNKWDGLSTDERRRAERLLDLKLGFIDHAAIFFISALHGSGVGKMIDAVAAAWRSAFRKIPTPELNQLLDEAVMRHPPPLTHGRRIKLRYAHQGGSNPPRIVIHGNQVDNLPDAYRRYLSRYFRNALRLVGTPVWIETRKNDNPYEGRVNKLTPRQQRRRKRMLKHVKRR
ncbi:MAG: ribosome biogenesis GTPase Der [Pseudomonadota bacterium]